MKFAVACLIGSVSAMGKFYDWESLGKMKKQWEDIKDTYMQNIDKIEEADMKEKARLAEEFEPFGQHFEEMGDAFGDEFMAWMQSSAVQKKQAYERDTIWPSKKMHKLIEAGEHVGEDVMDMDWAAGFSNKGYFEQVSNEDMKELFEDIYEVKEAFKRLATSRMAMKNNELGMATLEDEHFQNMVNMWKEREECEFLKKLGKKICHTLRRWKK